MKKEERGTSLKTPKQMERHLKGMANHYRIAALLLLSSRGTMTLEDVVAELSANERTVGEHLRRLHIAGLVNKQHCGRFVEHTLSPYGKVFARFLSSFRNI